MAARSTARPSQTRSSSSRSRSPRKGTPKGSFLPPGALPLLQRRLKQAAGLAVVTLALLLVLALLTYTEGDPSLNAAGSEEVGNLMGPFGAVISDLLLQSVGGAAMLVAVVMVAWGGRLMTSATAVSRLWMRLLTLLAAVLMGAVALQALPAANEMALPAGLGGAAGTLLLERLAALPHVLGLSAAPLETAAALTAAALTALLTAHAMGLSWQEWVATGRSLRRAGSAVGEGGVRLGRAGGEMLSSLRDRREPSLGAPEDGEAAPASPKQRRPSPSAAAPAARPARQAPVDLVEAPAPRAQPARRDAPRESLPATEDGYELPPLALLAPAPESGGQSINEDQLMQNARLLESVLQDFGVNGEIVKVRPGPVVTLYELEPAPGTKTSRVIGLADDIARSMSALSVRIAVIPGRSVIGIELPNRERETVYLRELLASDSYERNPSRLTLVLGKDIGGTPIMADLARMPHLLIAGTTGSGKSVAINTMILSLLYRLAPEECRMIMIDPKMLELSVYDGIPHLLAPVVTEPGKAVVALKWAVREMEDRYRAMSQLGVRNIAGYNQRVKEAASKGETLTRTVQTGFDPDTGKPIYEDQELNLEPLPFIVVIVDEMADLMLVAGKDVEAAIQRLAQMARAAGIHIIMATQRPSVDVITGTIKANFPTRISFQVSSKIDSRTILGEQGAEQLLGQGDMLYMAAGGRITRVHGPFVSDSEVEAVVEHLRAQGEPTYLEEVTEEVDGGGQEETPGSRGDSGDALYDQAVALVAREGKASTSFIQRHLQIGYNRAARIIERMETEGVVSRANHVGKREVLVRSGGDDY